MRGNKMNNNNNNNKSNKGSNRKLILISVSLLFIIFLNLITVRALQDVYFYEPDSKGILKPVLQNFDASGEINVGEEVKRAYLGAEGDNPKNSLGYIKNVKIKREGDNIALEFKENGDVTKFGEDGKSYEYDNIKPSGKFIFDSSGKIVKADFETTGKGNYYLNDFMYEVPAETKFNFENKIVGLKLNQGGEFSYFKESDKKKTYRNIKRNGEFKVNDKGELVFARFEVSAETDFSLRGYKYKLAANSKVNFENNKVDITVPDGTKISTPEKISGETADASLFFSFSTESGKGVTLPSGDIVENKNGKTIVNYRDGFYISDKSYVLKTSDGKEDLLISTNGKDTYLYFEGDTIDDKKNYVFVGKDKIITNSPSGEGASLFILPGNRLGIKTTSENTIAVEAKNGKVIIEMPVGDNPPSIKLSKESIVTLDRRSFYGQGNELYFDPKKVLAGDFNNGRFSASAKLSFVDDNGNNLKNFDVYSNDKDQYAAVSEKDLKSPFKYFKTKLGFYVSSSLTFNQLSYDAQRFYDSLDSQKQQEIARYVNNGEKSGAGNLQILMKKLIDEEIRIRQNPAKASVRVLGGGGSGTIIGVDSKDGKPIILTAGHLGGATSPGYRYGDIQLFNGKTVTGVSLGGYSDYGGSGNDYALIKVDQVIPGVAYVPVASESRPIKQGDLALRIGCPGCGDFKQTQTRLGSIGSIIGHGTNEEIIGGESGGGLFSKGRVVGVVSTGGYYTGTVPVRNFLRKMGYGYLISVSLVFRDVFI
jgi:hypothetical protein